MKYERWRMKIYSLIRRYHNQDWCYLVHRTIDDYWMSKINTMHGCKWFIKTQRLQLDCIGRYYVQWNGLSKLPSAKTCLFFNGYMSINKLSHLKEWDKIYRSTWKKSTLTRWYRLCFHDVNWCTYWVTDEEYLLYFDELKQLINDRVPKQRWNDRREDIMIETILVDRNSYASMVRVIIESAWWLFRYDRIAFPRKKSRTNSLQRLRNNGSWWQARLLLKINYMEQVCL